MSARTSDAKELNTAGSDINSSVRMARLTASRNSWFSFNSDSRSSVVLIVVISNPN